MPSTMELLDLLRQVERTLLDLYHRTWSSVADGRPFSTALDGIRDISALISARHLSEPVQQEIAAYIQATQEELESVQILSGDQLSSGQARKALRLIEDRMSDIRSLILPAQSPPRQGVPRSTSLIIRRAGTDSLLPADFARLGVQFNEFRIPAPELLVRHANAALFDPDSGRRLRPRSRIKLGQVLNLRLDVGPLSKGSLVDGQIPFPDHLLPKDITLDVMVSSSDFSVGKFSEPEKISMLAHAELFLPGDGSPAVNTRTQRYLHFLLKAPTVAGEASCRIGYYYKNFLVQSQHLVVPIGRVGRIRMQVDFTLSQALTGLEDLPKKPRVSVLTNANPDGTHQIIARSINPETKGIEGMTFAFKETAVADTLKKFRDALAARAPKSKQRSKIELEQDLRALAPHGWTLYAQGPAQRFQELQAFKANPNHFVLAVLRPNTSNFVFPWALVYDIPLPGPKLNLCPLVEQWDGVSALVDTSVKACPHEAHHGENVLCPFGFWGFRYSIEQLSSTDKPVTTIKASEDFTLAVAQTQFQVNLAALQSHVTNVRSKVIAAFPKAKVEEGKDKSAIRTLLGQDLPIVYFYCHGERLNISDPNIWLGVGNREAIPAKEFIGWVVIWANTLKKLIWNDVRPLVFINACHSAAVYPETLVSYLDAFIGTARAAGVVGTETKVNQTIAMDVAENFFDSFVVQKDSVDMALNKIRLSYLARGNLVGLIYTPYCFADLRMS